MRRTAIKDVSAYCAFLLGFIGSAPFAWRYLSAQLESGAFVRGLWYFFALVTVSALLCGITGLAVGILVGWVWEQFHRRRRSHNQHQVNARAAPGDTPPLVEAAATAEGWAAPDSPTLRLVSAGAPAVPDLSGRKLASIRFHSDRVELDFSGVVVVTADSPIVVSGMQRFRYPDASSRDALCSLIGASVEAMRTASGERIELRFGADRQLIVPHPRYRSVTIGNRT